MNSPSNFSKYFHTLRHIPAAQLGYLLWHRIKSFYRQRFPVRVTRSIVWRAGKEYPLNSIRWMDTAFQGTYGTKGTYERFRNGTVQILNRDHAFNKDDFWSLAESNSLSPLEVETLHYHTFLLELSLLSDKPEVVETIERTLVEWGKRFPPGMGAAWDSFTVAYRAQNWLRIHSQLASAEGKVSTLRTTLERSLFEHGLYLEQSLEKHLGGNHLLKDICALAMLSAFFEGPTAERWFRVVEMELPPQVEKQILPDGGHYERSPMYHVLVLVDLADAADSLRVRNAAWVDRNLAQVLERMVVFLEGVLHGDGEIPFFNDSVLGQAPSPHSVLKRYHGSHYEPSSGDSFESFPDSGFSKIRREGITLLFDHGRLGPDELMGHVHNDALSFEVSVGAERFLVNRGVYEYTLGEKRNQCRSIQSHNTPCVDGLEQSEIWGSFRVARRWHVDSSRSEAEAEGEWRAEGSWTRPGMPRITRSVRSYPGGSFQIEDQVEGAGRHTLVVPLHFSSQVSVEIREMEPGKAWMWEATCGDKSLHGALRASSPAELRMDKTHWWPRFQVEVPAVRLALVMEGVGPLRVETWIATQREHVQAEAPNT